MADVERVPYPTQTALDRLLGDKEAERLELGRKLGQLVWRNIDLANLDPSMHSGDLGDTPDGQGDEHTVNEGEHKVGKRMGACIHFAVPTDYEDSFETPDWLPLTNRLDLRLYMYDVDLPEDITDPSIPDYYSSSVIRISLEDDEQNDASTEDRRHEPYAAHHESGTPLDAQDTETVIGILALIADKVENS